MFNSTNGNGYSLSDIAAVTSGYGYGRNDGFFGGEGGSWWILVLFILLCFGGWNGNGNWGNGGVGNGVFPFMVANDTASDVQRGFDQSAVMSGLAGINSTVANGFASAEVSRCNSQANVLQTLSNNQMGLYQTLNNNQMGLYQTLNSNQNATTAATNALAMSLQNCCCENRAGLADLKYTVATENCADRAAVSDGIRDIIAASTANTQALLNSQTAGFQAIQDKLCQMEIDGLKDRNAELLAKNNALEFAQSQTAQTAQILAHNAAQTAALEQYLNPAPIPAYVVQNPNCCNTNYYGGCGCAA